MMESRSASSMRRLPWVRAGFTLTAVMLAATLASILLSGAEPDRVGSDEYLPLAWVATFVIVAVFVVAALVRRASVSFGEAMPWVIGMVSLLVSLIPWWAVFAGGTDLGARIYRGLRVPQGLVQFWDLELPLKSIDCASYGFDVYAAGNGCLRDPTIYGPGLLWLRWVPFDLVSARNTAVLGVIAIVASSLFLLWLARRTEGLGQVVLLLAAIGGPWLLLLERGNIDAFLLWGAAIVVMLVARRDALWSWGIAAAVLWLLGTWKYYPFAMGLMLIPALRLRRGWIVLTAFAVATVAYVLATWSTLEASMGANSAMADARDLAGIGRIPVVVRMAGMMPDQVGPPYGHVLVFGVAIAAACWGVAAGRAWHRLPVSGAMLGIAGAAMYLTSVLVAGFGFGYKATFLLLGVPIISRLLRTRNAALLSSGLCVVICTAVAAVVVWNTVLATLCGLISASFVLGLSAAVIVRAVRRGATTPPATAATAPQPQSA